MKPEPKVKQVWSIFQDTNEWHIIAIHSGHLWLITPSNKTKIAGFAELDTMVRDEHGNKPTEDNDDVVFYDVVQDECGIYGVKDDGIGGLGEFITDGIITLTDLLLCKDKDGRRCVGFLYESETDGYFCCADPIYCNRAYFSPKPATEEFVKKHIKDAEFKIPVKAVFKRLEAR